MLTKHASKVLILLLALLVGGGLLAAKAPAEAKQYDYLTVVYTRRGVHITYGATKFEEKKVETKSLKDYYDFTPFVTQLSELEAQGYEVVENSFQPGNESRAMSNYALMRKPK